MIVVDAKVWVSSLVSFEKHHLASRRWLDERLASDETLVFPTLALPEVAGAIARQTGEQNFGRRAAAGILDAPGVRLVGLDALLGEEAAQAAATYQLRGADAVYVAVAHALGAPLATWDRDIHARASGFIQVVEP